MPRPITGSRDTVVSNNNKNKVSHVMGLKLNKGCGLCNTEIWNIRRSYMTKRGKKQGEGQRSVIKIGTSGQDSLVRCHLSEDLKGVKNVPGRGAEVHGP